MRWRRWCERCGGEIVSMLQKTITVLTVSLSCLSGLAWMIGLIAASEYPCGDHMCGTVELMAAFALSLLTLPFVVWHLGKRYQIRPWLNLALSISSPFLIVGAIWAYNEAPQSVCWRFGETQPAPPNKRYYPSDEKRLLRLGGVELSCSRYSWGFPSNETHKQP